MRFQRLHIPAFGPFTDLSLEFQAEAGDFQVVYGANEAGKSSLLRAVRDLLFGIPNQSPDNFLHDYTDLRIHGEIRNRAGESLLFQRRKGNKNTILDHEGNPLPDKTLARFLAGVDQAYFSAMFGLGARELRDGARQLLRGEGDMGHALFSASMGGTPVQRVLKALTEESERFFKGRATTHVSIRPAAHRYRELLKQSREAMMNPEVWDKLETELAEADAAKRVLEDEITKLERELGWISRCEDALPAVGRLGEEMQKLRQLPTLPELASDFVPRTIAARQAVAKAHSDLQRLTEQSKRLETQLANCHTSPTLLAEADTLDRLHQDLGAYRQSKMTLADLKTKLAGLEPLLRAGMHSLQLAGECAALADHRLGSPARLACEEAAKALKAALASHETNCCHAEELQRQIKAQETQLRSLPETNLTGLREALAVAAEATDADRTFCTSELELTRLIRDATDQHKQILGAPKDLDGTAGLPVPALATIRRYHEQMELIKREIKTEETKILDSRKRAETIQRELGRLQRQGELPSEEALRKARNHRDHGWRLVLGEWKGPGATEELITGLPLEQAFPQTILRADELADALRGQAEAVAQFEEKRLQLTELESQIAATSHKVGEGRAALDACLKSWEAEWSECRITPHSPAEMLEWRDNWAEFKERLRKLRTAEAAFQRKLNQIQTAKQRLAAALGESEQEEFSLLFDKAKRRVQEGEQLAGRRIEIAHQITKLTADLSSLEESRARLQDSVNAATTRWRVQSQAAGLAEGTSPDCGMTLLRERNELFAKFDTWQELSQKLDLTAAAIRDYEDAVNKKAHALGIAGETTEALESILWKALADARRAQTSSDHLTRQLEQLRTDFDQAQTRANEAEHALRELAQRVGIENNEELEPFLAHVEQRNGLLAQINNLRSTLSGLARGQSVDDFVAQVRAENPDELPERKAKTDAIKREKELALSAACETLFRLGSQKRQLEQAGDTAARYRQEAESCAAALREDAARFVRLRLAAHLLQVQIERFRRENQGPLLQKSGELFKAITGGAFAELAAEFNADDLPVLVGVRPDLSKVPVEGMSDGSRDQLYLALRLAALGRHLEEHEPMPLVLDDLLITFDDERARAILPELAALAKRTQIFLFTHHQHLVELCRQTLGEGHFQLHVLGSRPLSEQ